MSYSSLIHRTTDFESNLKDLAPVELHQVLREACSAVNLPMVKYLVDHGIPLIDKDLHQVLKTQDSDAIRWVYENLGGDNQNRVLGLSDTEIVQLYDMGLLSNDDETLIYTFLSNKRVAIAEKMWLARADKSVKFAPLVQKLWRKLGRDDLCPVDNRRVPTLSELQEFFRLNDIELYDELQNLIEAYQEQQPEDPSSSGE